MSGFVFYSDDESEDQGDDEDEESPAEGKDEPAEPEAEKGDRTEKEKCPEIEKAETDSVEGDKKEGEDAAAQEAEDEEDPSNLQLAWEMLELAKMVFSAQIEGAQKANLSDGLKATLEKRLCETYLTLGEVSLENENYVQAVEDISLCLERQQVRTLIFVQLANSNIVRPLCRRIPGAWLRHTTSLE